jgi:hypothetical protein
MNPNVPAGAAILLDFIGSIEAPKGYGTIFANKQDKLPKPLTEMTLDEVQAAQALWSKRNGSSAAGRYQFMRATLKGLMAEMGLRGSQHMTPDLQDLMGYHLLKRRGYLNFVAGELSLKGFALGLAKEWASLPVLSTVQGAHRQLSRGDSYYAGDKLNKSLTKAGDFEAVLAEALNAAGRKTAQPAPAPAPAPKPQTPAPEPAKPRNTRGIVGWIILAAVGIASGAAALWQHIANFFGGLF